MTGKSSPRAARLTKVAVPATAKPFDLAQGRQKTDGGGRMTEGSFDLLFIIDYFLLVNHISTGLVFSLEKMLQKGGEKLESGS